MKKYLITLLLLICQFGFCQSPLSMGNVKVNGETNSAVKNLESINNKLFYSQNTNNLFNPNFTSPWVSDGTLAGTIRLSSGAVNSNPAFVNVGNMAYFFDNDGLKKSDGTLAGTILIKAGIYSIGFSDNLLYCTAVNNILYFVNSADSKLWKSDGTDAGTVVVKDNNSPTFIRNLTAANGLVFFIAEDPINGVELWRSDGSEAGTVVVKDIFPGTNGSYPTYLTAMNNILFFSASKNFAAGNTLWRSDGTTAGTFEITNFDGTYSPGSPKNFTVFNNMLYFTSVDLLWKTDGSPNGAIEFGGFVAPGNPNVQRVNSIFVSNTTLLLSTRNSNETAGSNLFKSDGTLAGTIFLKKLQLPNKINFSDDIKQYTTLNGVFYFSAFDNLNGFELWKSDGTTAGTVMVKNINYGVLDSNPLRMNILNNRIYFFANTFSHGHELWTSDGTEAGTYMVKDIQQNNFDSNPSQFLQVGTKVYFSAETTENANLPVLMVSTVNNSFSTIVQPSFGSIKYPSNFTNFNNLLYLSGSQNNNRELFKSDGTFTNTERVLDINPGNPSSNPDYLTVANNTLYFAATTALNGRELWKSNGTAAGTVLVKDIFPSTVVISPGGTITTIQNSNPFRLTNHNGLLYFAATTQNGTELWKSDGNEANTVMVQDINIGGNGLSSVAEIKSTPNTLFFTANNGTIGTELWKIDAANPNGILIKDISLGASSSDPTNLTAVGNTIYFSAATQGFDGRELWKSDGTTAGTVIVRNFAGNFSSNPLNITNLNGTVYFTADDNVNGRELYKSDGSLAGTFMLKDINLTGSSDPSELTVVNNTLYFTANDGVHGRELWKTDGTTEGTLLAYNFYDEINSDPLLPKNSSNPSALYSFNNVLYFGANSGKLGNEPYRFVPCSLTTNTVVKDAYLPSQTLNTTQNISASNTIFPNRTVNYFAGNSILLSPGFKVSAGAGENNTFRAEVRGCN
jgi:ELWxxDGT repeat protein